MAKALIIGVTGQDGSYLSELLLSKKYNVMGLRRRTSSGSLWRLKDCLNNDNFTLAEGDITDYSSLLQILDHYKPDEIYNLSAQSNVGTSFNQPGLTWDVTAKGVMNLLECMRFLKSAARLYQASSSEMYGASFSERERIIDEYYQNRHKFEKYQDEYTPFNPQSPYAIAKLAAHNMVNLYRQAYGIWACGGILFNHESPRRGLGFVTRKITSWFKNYLDGIDEYKHQIRTGILNYFGYTKLKLGNIESFRDWGYAPEYVEAMWLMLQQDNPKDYVIGTGETHTIKEFLQEVMNYHIFDMSIENLIGIDDAFKRPSDVPYLRADASLAQKELGWKPKTKFGLSTHNV